MTTMSPSLCRVVATQYLVAWSTTMTAAVIRKYQSFTALGGFWPNLSDNFICPPSFFDLLDTSPVQRRISGIAAHSLGPVPTSLAFLAGRMHDFDPRSLIVSSLELSLRDNQDSRQLVLVLLQEPIVFSARVNYRSCLERAAYFPGCPFFLQRFLDERSHFQDPVPSLYQLRTVTGRSALRKSGQVH